MPQKKEQDIDTEPVEITYSGYYEWAKVYKTFVAWSKKENLKFMSVIKRVLKK